MQAQTDAGTQHHQTLSVISPYRMVMNKAKPCRLAVGEGHITPILCAERMTCTGGNKDEIACLDLMRPAGAEVQRPFA